MNDPKWREPTPEELKAYEKIYPRLHHRTPPADFRSFMVGLGFGFAFGVGITLVVLL